MDLMILIIEIMFENFISHLNLNLRDNEIALIKCMYYVEGFIEGYIEGFVEGFVVGFVWMVVYPIPKLIILVVIFYVIGGDHPL